MLQLRHYTSLASFSTSPTTSRSGYLPSHSSWSTPAGALEGGTHVALTKVHADRVSRCLPPHCSWATRHANVDDATHAKVHSGVEEGRMVL